jgi:hypothetical protein
MEVQRFKKKEKDIFDRLSDATNRSLDQTKFLLNLVDGDFLKLIELEEKLKNNFQPTPGDKETAQKVLDMGYGKYWWKLNFFTSYDKKPYLNQIIKKSNSE